MGKGKIVIHSEGQEQQPEPNHTQTAASHTKPVKKKHKKNKVAKPAAEDRPRISALEMIADEQDRRDQFEKQHQQDLQDEEQQEQLQQRPIRTMLSSKCRLRNLSICFPDSILQIPQTSALRSYFIGEVARISSIFKVDEIIILRDHGYNAKSEAFKPSEYIARNMQYLETPQYLRKNLFKMHPDLKNAGLMNPIECHHHLKTNDICEFREGVSLDRPTKAGAGSWVDIGLKQQARMNVMVLPNTRVTLRLKDYQERDASFYEAEAVSKKVPREEQNLYWGYDVRIADSFKQLLKGGDYDLKIICNHHEKIQQIDNICDFDTLDLEDKSVLIFFSGTDDLSTLIARDEKAVLSAEQIIKRFDYSLAFENFGVQKLRMEEQLFMGLCKLSKHIE